jgi:hypothetical protein
MPAGTRLSDCSQALYHPSGKCQHTSLALHMQSAATHQASWGCQSNQKFMVNRWALAEAIFGMCSLHSCSCKLLCRCWCWVSEPNCMTSALALARLTPQCAFPATVPVLPVLPVLQGAAAMSAASQLAARALQLAGSMVQPGVTTEQLDAAVHEFIVANGAYPSPLSYHGFPKSICTSVNEVVCHGIPDSRCAICRHDFCCTMRQPVACLWVHCSLVSVTAVTASISPASSRQ